MTAVSDQHHATSVTSATTAQISASLSHHQDGRSERSNSQRCGTHWFMCSLNAYDTLCRRLHVWAVIRDGALGVIVLAPSNHCPDPLETHHSLHQRQLRSSEPCRAYSNFQCHEQLPPPPTVTRLPGALLKGGGGGFLTPTETNIHRDALYFLVMGPSLLQKLAGGWWLVTVGGWRLVAGGWWGLVGGGWRLEVPGGCP